jgi:hypothetical protein
MPDYRVYQPKSSPVNELRRECPAPMARRAFLLYHLLALALCRKEVDKEGFFLLCYAIL